MGKTPLSRILLVDDSEDVPLLVSRSLRMFPHELVWAESAAEGLELARGGEFDFVVLDVNLPDGGGYSLCLALRKILPHVPVFFLTGNNTSTDLLAGFLVGGEDFLTKPFRPYELRARALARLRRAYALAHKDFWIETGRFRVNVTKGQAWAGSAELRLTAAELQVFHHLLCSPDRPVSAEVLRLAAELAGEPHAKVERITAALEKKLGDYGACVNRDESGCYQIVIAETARKAG